MRKQIAKRINDWYHHFDREDGFVIADQIIRDLCKKIEKVENPHVEDARYIWDSKCRKEGFDDAKQRILETLEV